MFGGIYPGQMYPAGVPVETAVANPLNIQVTTTASLGPARTAAYIGPARTATTTQPGTRTTEPA